MLLRQSSSGIVGCAAQAATATGRFGRVENAVEAYVRYGDDIEPDPAWAERYARMQPIFDRVYANSQPLYAALDELGD